MSGAVNIIANIASFDELQNAHIDQLGQFHDLDNVQNGDHLMPNSGQMKNYEQGLEDGYLKAEERAQDHAALSSTITQSLLDIKTEIEAGHRLVVTALLQAALPALTKKNMTGEIIDFMMSLSTPTLAGQVKFWVNPNFEAALKEITQDISNASSEQTAFTIETDENLPGHAVRATWQGGSGTIDIESTVKKLLTRIEL